MCGYLTHDIDERKECFYITADISISYLDSVCISEFCIEVNILCNILEHTKEVWIGLDWTQWQQTVFLINVCDYPVHNKHQKPLSSENNLDTLPVCESLNKRTDNYM